MRRTMTLTAAWAIAEQAHGRQLDLAGKPYLGHVATVAAHVCMPADDVLPEGAPVSLRHELMHLAVLHDVLEDAPGAMTAADHDALGPVLARSLDAITRKRGEAYPEFIHRVSLDPAATIVKLADLKHHLERADLLPSTPSHERRVAKYRKAVAYLLAARSTHDLDALLGSLTGTDVAHAV